MGHGCLLSIDIEIILHDEPLFNFFPSLKTAEAFQQPYAGINGLISSFVKLLQVGITLVFSFLGSGTFPFLSNKTRAKLVSRLAVV